ncbi:peptidase family M13 [Xylariaceae sp. FL0804]|nr:peptidase family M13 [Xylariaceae sp. FL0804]
MAQQEQPDSAASTERSPLLHRVSNEGNDDDDNDGQVGREGTAGEGELGLLTEQVRKLRRRRWISLIASAFLIIAFVVILFLSGLLSRSRKRNPNMNMSTCTTPACIHAASEILYNLSPDYKTIDPCTKFDTLVCEGFNIRRDVPEDDLDISTFRTMFDDGWTTLRHILESPYPNRSQHLSFSQRNLNEATQLTDRDNFLKMQKAYNVCMDEASVKEVGISPLVELIEMVATAFPVTEESGSDGLLSQEDYVNLGNTIVLLEQLQVSSFERLTVEPDEKDPNVAVIKAFPAGLFLPSSETYQDNATINQYRSMLSEVFSILHPANASRMAADEIARSLIELEKQIAEITPPTEAQQGVTTIYNAVKVAEAGDVVPAIRLEAVINALVPSHYTVDTVMLAFPEFLGNVSEILSSTSRSTVQSFLIWKLISSYSSIEAPAVGPLAAIKRFRSFLFGKKWDVKTEHWEECVSHVYRTLGKILKSFYLEAVFPENAEEFSDQIILDVKQQFISKLRSLDWIDESEKMAAVGKVNNMNHILENPTTSLLHPSALQEYYAGLVITDSFLNNSLSSRIWSVNKSWSALGNSIDGDDFLGPGYRPAKNDIVLTPGLMQFPVFSVDLPSYVSYGAFAFIIGHEVSHAFGSSGRHFDANGEYTAGTWWNDRTVEGYEERARCFESQYSKIMVEADGGGQTHVNGSWTREENIADAVGLSTAFAAWQMRQWMERTGEEVGLPGLEHFTPQQLFFVFSANLWCQETQKPRTPYPGVVVPIQDQDSHAPNRARLLGSVANSRGFRESFNCPVKEPTCEMW